MNMNQKGRGEDCFRTPSYLYNQLNNMFAFTTDAACTKTNCLSPSGFYFDEKIDGLKQSWKGLRVFCNPPFSGKDQWMKKAHDEVLNNGCFLCVMILPSNSMDSKPWHEYVYGKFYYEILLGRVSFIDPNTMKPKSGNNSGTTIVYFWKKPSRPI